MLSYELPKSEPNILTKMPGRKHLVFGRLKDNGISKKVLVSPFWSPLDSVYAFSLRKKQENVPIIEEWGKCLNSGRTCALIGRELVRKLRCGLKTIAHSNKIQDRRMSNR